MKSFVILTFVLTIAIAQRPGYLSGPVGYPGLASRFQTDNPTDSSSSTLQPVVNRLGENDQSTTEKLPVDARGDADLVHRLNQWPRENRPFWILNAEHIEKHRNPQAQQGQQNFVSLPSRGSFDQFGNPSLTQTIRPLQTRGSFAGGQQS